MTKTAMRKKNGNSLILTHGAMLQDSNKVEIPSAGKTF